MIKKYLEMYKTIETKQVEGTSEFLKVVRQEYRLGMGETIIRDHIVKPNLTGSAVVVLPITKEGKFVLVIQPRVLTKNGALVEVPAGYIEPGEDPFQAALRELEEETGYRGSELVLIKDYYQDQGCMQAFNHAFIAWECEKRTDQHLDFDEHIQYFEATYEEVLELVEMGYIIDANSLLTIEFAKPYVTGKTHEISNNKKIF